jgi:hypothetical protein
MTMKDDLANRSRDIHWPTGFDPAKADLFSHNELVINAPCERVWQHIIDVTKWPEWYPNSRMSGSWMAPSLQTSGYSAGPRSACLSCLSKARSDGCRVVTDEVGMGKNAAHLRETDESLMHRGHDLWLATLKWISEGR